MDVKEITKDEAQKAIKKYFHNRKVTTIHVLDKIFPKQRRIRSLIGGLETSFGIKMWEKLAKTFAEKNGFTVLDEKDFNKNGVPANIPAPIIQCLDKWKHEREKYQGISLDNYLSELKKIIRKTDISKVTYGKMPKGEGLDIWVKKNNKEYLFDTKTNQINAGGGPKYNEQIMRWYMYRLVSNPDLKISCHIAFPFNPYSGDFWIKTEGKAKPLLPSRDALVEDEFWNALSGEEQTWSKMMAAFDELKEEGFGKQFESIFNLITDESREK